MNISMLIFDTVVIYVSGQSGVSVVTSCKRPTLIIEQYAGGTAGQRI